MRSREHRTVWRKKRDGREYGSYHGYVGGRIVNLMTTSIDEAHRKARELLGTAAAPITAPGVAPSPPGPTAAVPASPPSQQGAPSYLHQWASGGGGPGTPAPANGNAPAPPPSPQLSSAMDSLAESMAFSLARFNALAVSLAVKHFAEVQPPKLDPAHIELMEKSWATGLKELMLLQGLKWWHILLAQNGALALELYQNGTPIPPKPLAPMVAAGG
jgi:hypothetical protein